MSDETVAADIATDLQTINDYVDTIIDAQNRIATAYNGALDQFQLVMQTASPQEARPDFVGVALKTGLKSGVKAAAAALDGATGVDVGPVVEMITAISDEIDRAAAAAANRSVADWISGLRTSAINAYLQGQTRQDLKKTITAEYYANDEGGRGGYIADIENEMEAAGKLTTVDANKHPVPLRVELIETPMYTGWINANFNDDCMSDAGLLLVSFNSDGTLDTAKVLGPLGDRVGARLNSIMGTAGYAKVMDLPVVKRVTRDTKAMCFDQNNGIRMDTNDDDAHTFLTAPETWAAARSFTTTS